MDRHAERALEYLGQLGDSRMGDRIHRNGVLEKFAEQHRADGHVSDHDRRYGQQHQGNPDDPGRLVRRLVCACMPVVVIVVVRVRILVEALLAMEHQKIQPE